MRFLVVFCTILVLICVSSTFVSAKKHDHHKSVLKQCQKNEETHIDPDVLKKLKDHLEVVELPDNYPDHVICIMRGMGYVTNDNTVNEKKLKKLVRKKANEDQDVEAVVSECNVVKATLKETALNLLNCLKTHNISKI